MFLKFCSLAGFFITLQITFMWHYNTFKKYRRHSNALQKTLSALPYITILYSLCLYNYFKTLENMGRISFSFLLLFIFISRQQWWYHFIHEVLSHYNFDNFEFHLPNNFLVYNHNSRLCNYLYQTPLFIGNFLRDGKYTNLTYQGLKWENSLESIFSFTWVCASIK